MTIINGRYELHERMGQGGMAEVFRATQLSLSRQVAIKFIKSDLKEEVTTTRFKREAKAIAQLNHPNITQVYDFDVAEDGRYYMVMELLQGQDLAAFLHKNSPLKLGDIVTVMNGVTEGLRYAHERQIVHRDVKPSNIFITEQLQVKIMDFGIAKWITGGSQTDFGGTVGTPKYFAPEQAQGHEVDQRVDLYSMGVVFYELLTGVVPYDGDTLARIILHHLSSPIPDPREKRPDLPPIASVMVMKTLAKDPTERYPSVAHFQQDLNRFAATITSTDDALLPVVSLDYPSDQTLTDTPTFNLSQTILQQQVKLPVAAILMAVVLVLFLGGLVWWGNREPVEESLAVAPVAEREYLILVGQWPNDSEGTLQRRIAEALRASDSLGYSPTLSFRVESLPILLKTTEEAQTLAESVGAQLVVWGVQDEVGVEVIFQDIFAEPRSISQLRFIIPNTPDYNAILAQDMPIALRYYLDSMLLHHFIRTSDLDSLAGFGFLTAEQPGQDLRVLPLSDVDRHILSMFSESDEGNVEGTIEAATNVLRLAPDDYTLLFLRFYNEGFYRGNIVRAKADAEELYAKMGSNNFSEWVMMNINLVEEEYEAVLARSERLDPSSLGYTIPFSYRQLALLMLGNYEQIQTEITDEFAAQSVFGLPLWDAVKAMTFAIQDDQTQLEALRARIQANRDLEVTANFVTNISSPPLVFYIIGGYISELNGDVVTASLVYPLAANFNDEQYIINWRRGVLAGNAESAANFYQVARQQAPVPFPIAAYQQALVAVENGVPRSACELLGEAKDLAEAEADFYALLLEKIAQAQTENAC